MAKPDYAAELMEWIMEIKDKTHPTMESLEYMSYGRTFTLENSSKYYMLINVDRLAVEVNKVYAVELKYGDVIALDKKIKVIPTKIQAEVIR